MQVNVEALVVRNKETHRILDVRIIEDVDAETYVDYPNDMITLAQLKDHFESWGQGTWEDIKEQFELGKDVRVHAEAGLFPSIGKVLVDIETRVIDWS